MLRNGVLKYSKNLSENEFMRVIIVLLVSIISASCSNTPRESKYSSNDTSFKKTFLFGCNIKYPNSEKLCECRADVIYESTPPEVRSRFMTDPSGTQMEVVSVMLKNTDKLEACGKPPTSENNGKEPIPTVCYSGSDKPVYYLGESELGKLLLTEEQLKLINSVDHKVSMDEIKSNFYSSVSEEMKEFSNAIDSQLNSDSEKKKLNVNKIFAKAASKSVQCTDENIRKFYTTEEVEALYKLHYAGYSKEDAMEAIFQQGVLRRNLDGVRESQQREELGKYFKCEMTICMRN